MFRLIAIARLHIDLVQMVIIDPNSGPAALSSEARLALEILERAKAPRERGAFEEAIALVDDSLAKLAGHAVTVASEDFPLRVVHYLHSFSSYIEIV